MKKLYKYLLAVATVAMAFTSCSKDEFSNPSTETQKVTFTVTSGSDLETPPASRTEFDEETGQMNWSADGEALEVIQILDTINAHATTEAYTIENRVAKFQVSFKALTGSEPYDLTYSAIYPAVNYSGNTNDYTKFRIKLPAEQTPTETGFDPNADLLLAKPETRTAQPAEGEELNFRFKRVAAIAKMTLKGIPAGEKLAKVELTASQPMAGYSRTNLKTGEIYDIGYYKEETMTLTLNDRETTGEDVIWFTSLPCVFGEGDSFTVKAYTDKATYEKTVSFSTPEAFKFVSGGLTRFGITGMTRTESVVDEYVLLTNVADLSVGDQIIITSGTDGAVKAISTTQNKNNRAATDIEIASNTITTIPANAQIITLETGMEANTFAFHVVGDATGYLYAASSSKNYLKTQDNIDGNASWTIDVAESGVATIKAQGDYTRNLLQYNNSNTLFSCYSSKQQDVYIFYKAGSPKTALETPTGVEAVAKGNEVLVGWKPVAGATSYTVSFEPATIEPKTVLHDDAKAEYSEIFENLDYATEYTVSVVANPADTENYKASAPATATFTTGENPNHQVYTMVGDDANLGEGQYIFAALNGTEYLAATSLEESKTYGYLPFAAVMVNENQIASNTTNDAYAFTLEASDTPGQYYLKDTYGRYMYNSGSYNSFNVASSKDTDNTYLWTISMESDGTVSLKNVASGKWMQRDASYGTFGIYDTEKGARPYAFKLNDGSLVPPTPKPTLAVSSENVAFAAAGESKEVTYTAENLGSNQVFATVSGENASQFSANVSNGTVTVTALENTETTAKTATLTLYIAASEGGEHLAEAIVALTQSAKSSGSETGTTITMTYTDIISGGSSSLPTNSYGSQDVNNESTYYTWAFSSLDFAGSRICIASSEDYAGLIQIQGNASDVSKQGFFGNVTDLGKITKIVVVSVNTSYEPSINLYMGTEKYPTTNLQNHPVYTQDGNVYTEEYVITGDYGYFRLWNDSKGATYIQSISITYEN